MADGGGRDDPGCLVLVAPELTALVGGSVGCAHTTARRRPPTGLAPGERPNAAEILISVELTSRESFLKKDGAGMSSDAKSGRISL